MAKGRVIWKGPLHPRHTAVLRASKKYLDWLLCFDSTYAYQDLIYFNRIGDRRHVKDS